jgi:hypothetical protein
MVFKSRRLRWAGHVACGIREKGNVHRVFVGGGGCLKGIDHFEDLSTDGKII